MDPIRKIETARNLRAFCEAYFPRTFCRGWSSDHLEVIARLEDAILRSGLFALAMPRGSGKTSLLRVACIWAVVTGARRYVLFLGADEDKAAKSLRSIKTELANNSRLLDDWPEVVQPITALERITQRSSGQLLNGEPTNLIWTKSEVVLPTVAGSAASGAILQVDGLLGAVRGPNYTQPDGTTVRPELVVIDDAQTDVSARSPYQTQTRLEIVSGAVLNLSGPGVAISGVLLGTVISPGDMLDRLLDRQAHPEWRGVRKKLLYEFPSNMALWDKYAEIRADSLRAGGDGKEATEFYAQHRDAMDAGAVVAWAERRNDDELSALQHAMNLYYRDRKAFFCEMQNSPEEEADEEALTADEIKQKLSGYRRGEIPPAAHFLTAFIDVHDKLLFWTVLAVEKESFTAWTVDYGTYPRQRAAYFTLRGARITLRHKAPKHARTKEGAILEGVIALADELFSRVWRSSDGAERHLDICLIDVGYEPDTVFAAIGRSGRSQALIPSRGVPIGPANKPIHEWRYAPGDRRGNNWGYFRRRRRYRTLEFDANAWKTFLMARLASVPGEPGSLSLFGPDPEAHQMLADHIAAETPIEVESHGRRIQEWRNTKQRDNHWLDCHVGALVGASFLGAQLPGGEPPRRRVDPTNRPALGDLRKQP